MKIDEFEKGLADLIGRPTSLRPFVCAGSPLDCDVFIAGVNPATEMSTDFWDFWIPGRGYDKVRWYDQYQAERAKKPLKLGKTRRYAISPTRRNTNFFIEGAAGSQVLETNLDSRPAEIADHLKKWSDLRVDVFEFLFNTIKPRAVLFHGKFALEAVERYGADTTARAEYHLSFQTSAKKARSYGVRAAQDSRSRL
ncbi:hypothetical protein [Paracoccus versutus]